MPALREIHDIFDDVFRRDAPRVVEMRMRPRHVADPCGIFYRNGNDGGKTGRTVRFRGTTYSRKGG